MELSLRLHSGSENTPKVNRIEILQCLLADWNKIELEINKRAEKSPRLNDKLLNNTWIKEEMPREMKRKYLELNKITTYKNLWDAAKSVFREIYSTECIF